MRTLALIVCLTGSLVGCIDSDPDGMPPGGGGSGTGSDREYDLNAAHACEGTTILYGNSDQAQPIIVPSAAYDEAGALICLELDARLNIREAHFAANTSYQAGMESAFQMALFGGGSDAMLLEGWDVSFGGDTAFANLEYSVPVGDYVAVKLLVRAKSGTAWSDVLLHLFEPFE